MGEFDVALAGQIRFNAYAHLEGERTMRKQFAVLAVGCLTLGIMAVLGSAQMDKTSRPSPAAKTSCALADGKTITVDYSSPRAKGGQIYGGLVPHGGGLRAGAHEGGTF